MITPFGPRTGHRIPRFNGSLRLALPRGRRDEPIGRIASIPATARHQGWYGYGHGRPGAGHRISAGRLARLAPAAPPHPGDRDPQSRRGPSRRPTHPDEGRLGAIVRPFLLTS